MPRILPSGLRELLDPRCGWAETHSMLRLQTRNGNFFFASAGITVDGVNFDPKLSATSQLKQSITQAIDRVECAVVNVDLAFGQHILKVQNALHGARATFGRYWRDLRNGAEFSKWLLSGVVVASPGDQSRVDLSIYNELYATRQISPRRVARLCQHKYKDPLTCGYAGPLATCKKTLDSPGGCDDHLNKHHYGGFVYIQ